MPRERPSAARRDRTGSRIRSATVGALLLVLVAVLGWTVAPEKDSGTPAVDARSEARQAPTAPDRQRLHGGTGLYPRAIRLEHNGEANGRILASTVSFDGNDGLGTLHESTDGGGTFRKAGSVADPAAADGRGQCCATLYELPRPVGDMPAGTLLWAASPSQNKGEPKMSIRVFKSTDLGRSWSYLSTVARSGNEKGLWEPEFSLDADGRLVCHYSDETDPAHSQKLMAARTSDGRRWTGHHATVASSLSTDRPGMAVVRRMPDGHYFMVYEICTPGGKFSCVVHYRTSRDGWHWGDPSHLGVRPETADGEYLTHTPNLAWTPEPGNPQGKLLLIGQAMYAKDGRRSPDSGNVVWSNDKGGEGSWTSRTSPVTVRSKELDFCPNYSSALLPSTDGSHVLQVATDYDAAHTCRPYYATGPL